MEETRGNTEISFIHGMEWSGCEDTNAGFTYVYESNVVVLFKDEGKAMIDKCYVVLLYLFVHIAGNSFKISSCVAHKNTKKSSPDWQKKVEKAHLIILLTGFSNAIRNLTFYSKKQLIWFVIVKNRCFKLHIKFFFSSNCLRTVFKKSFSPKSRELDKFVKLN